MILDTPQKKIRHLLRRTGFTASEAQVHAWQDQPFSHIIDDLLNAPATHPQPPQGLQKGEYTQLPLWWIDTMIRTTNPLLEKMTLFWHGHFTSSLQKVPLPDLMGAQNVLLRKHALGNFRTFTADISTDPAMLIWLDNNTNVKQAPNENYARELMELFTLGIGPYTEQDIHEVARALTGWRVNRQLEQAVFQPRLHDDGTKTIFGKTGAFNVKSTIDLIVEHPACAPFLTTKLWNFLISPNPDPAEIKRIANLFRSSDYDLKVLVGALLKSDAFTSDSAYRSLIKSPAEYVIGILALFPNLKLKNEKAVLQAMNLMGQTLFAPPNVAGWPGGPAWLSSGALFARANFAELVVSSLTTAELPTVSFSSADTLLQAVSEQVGLADLSDTTRAQIIRYLRQTPNREAMLRGALYLLFASPEAQMK